MWSLSTGSHSNSAGLLPRRLYKVLLPTPLSWSNLRRHEQKQQLAKTVDKRRKGVVLARKSRREIEDNRQSLSKTGGNRPLRSSYFEKLSGLSYFISWVFVEASSQFLACPSPVDDRCRFLREERWFFGTNKAQVWCLDGTKYAVAVVNRCVTSTRLSWDGLSAAIFWTAGPCRNRTKSQFPSSCPYATYRAQRRSKVNRWRQ